MSIKTIDSSEGILAKMIPASEWAEGSQFYSEDRDALQVGTWDYAAGKKLGPHIHNEVARSIHQTGEVIFIYYGSIKASIYDSQERLVEELELHQGDILILLAGGHGYEILEDGTRVIEIKNGPYLGAEIDRRIIGTGTGRLTHLNKNI